MSESSVFRSVRRPERRRVNVAMRIARILLVLTVVAVVAVFGWLVWKASHTLEPLTLQTLVLNETDPDALTDEVAGTSVTLVVGVDRRRLPPEDLIGKQADPRGPAVTTSIMLMQTSPKRPGTAVVTFPGALEVDPPGAVGLTRIDHVQALGGPDLLLETIQNLTGMPIDHYLEIDLAGLVGVIDAVGGVEVCLDKVVLAPEPGAGDAPGPIPPTSGESTAAPAVAAGTSATESPNPPASSPPPRPAGCQRLDGAAAAGFLSSRSDANVALPDQRQRIAEQHYLIGQLLERATLTSILANPLRASRILDALPRAVATDVDPGLRDMFSLADDIAGFDRDQLIVRIVPSFRTPDGGATRWYPDQAEALFAALRSGADLTGVGEVTPEELGPSDVNVLLVNGTGQEGLAGQAQVFLEQRDFRVAGAINPSDLDPRDSWDPSQEELVLRYLEGDEALVDILVNALGDLPIQRVPLEVLPPGVEEDVTVIMTVGSAWTG